jgi:hypothetical protein
VINDATAQLRHNIYRSTQPHFQPTPQTLLRPYHDTTVRPGTTYYYRVTAVKDGCESPPSRQNSDTTFKPDAPANTGDK